MAVYAPIGESLASEGSLVNIIRNSIMDKGFFMGFGVLTIAMCCQHSAFIVASSLDSTQIITLTPPHTAMLVQCNFSAC